MSISPELEPLAEVARSCKDAEEFVDNARKILRKITTNEIQSLTPRVGKGKPGRITITRYSGNRFELGIMIPWERTTTLKTLAYGKTEILEYLTDFYNQVVKSVLHEPVKGEQPGMLGVPGKYVEQKRPWTPGQVEIESYMKYKEAMGKPRVVTPEVTANLNNLLAHLKEAPLSKSSETYLRKSFGDEVLKQAYDAKLITRSPKDIYTITLKGQEVLKAIPKAKAKVELEATESPEELDRKLREFERERLKEQQAEEAKELEKILSGMMGKKKKPKVEAEAMKQAEKPSKNLYWYSVAELKKMCQNKSLSTEGSKESLIRRLR